MVKPHRYLLAILFVFASMATQVQGRIVVNEVMSNEPESYTALEWFELYNDGDAQADLSFYSFTVGGSQFTINSTIAARGYLVVCRKLVGIPGSPGFETYWGNNSAVWGDAASENYPVVEASFSLTNSSGTVLISLLGSTESSLSWTSSGSDGVSWERENPQSDVIKQSVDPIGATPGRVNSWAPVARDLALDTVWADYVGGSAQLTFVIRSLSLTAFQNGKLILYYVDPADTLNTDSQFAVISLPSIDSGVTTQVIEQYQFAGTYQRIGAAVGGDDRMYNNRKLSVAPGTAFPPVVLSEFLANPEGNLTTEWVEVKNREDTVVSLNGWRLGDSTQLAAIAGGALAVSASGYAVLAQDTAAFRSYYSSFTGPLGTATPWPSLNNSGDLLRLVDRFGLAADEFSYSEVYDSNMTWAKTEEGDIRWGREVDTGGSPGSANEVRFTPSAHALKVTIEPQIISPDGDGIDDSTVISMEVPESKGFTLKIYDIHGRLVRTFEDKASDFLAQYVWTGRDDAGARLPVGIYILYVEAKGVESIKKTVVVAR